MLCYRLSSVSVLVQACLLVSVFAEKHSQDVVDSDFDGDGDVSTLDATTKAAIDGPEDIEAYYLNSNPAGSDTTPQPPAEKQKAPAEQSTSKKEKKVIGGFHVPKQKVLAEQPTSKTVQEQKVLNQKLPAKPRISTTLGVIGGFHVPKQKVLANFHSNGGVVVSRAADVNDSDFDGDGDVAIIDAGTLTAQDATDGASDDNSDGVLDSESDDNSNAVLDADSDGKSADGSSDDKSGGNRIVTGDDAKHIKMQMDLQLRESEDMPKVAAPKVAVSDESHRHKHDKYHKQKRHHTSTHQVSKSDDNSADSEIVVSPNAKHIEMQMGIKLGEHHEHHEKKEPHKSARKAHLLRRDD